jgi:hypothetical protein
MEDTTPATTPATTPVTTADQSPELLALIESGRLFVRCGCGFIVASGDAYMNRRTMEDHDCNGTSGPTPWYGFVFSFWTWAIVATIGYVVIILTGHKL